MELTQLNLPQFEFRFKNENGKLFIFDTFRKKYVVNTPEEWVRQNMLRYLVEHKNYPQNWLSVEKEIDINGLKRRYDALVFNKSQEMHLLIEFKAPHIKIDKKVFNQIGAYNYLLGAPFLLVSNGMEHFFAKLDNTKKAYTFFKEIPNY